MVCGGDLDRFALLSIYNTMIVRIRRIQFRCEGDVARGERLRRAAHDQTFDRSFDVP